MMRNSSIPSHYNHPCYNVIFGKIHISSFSPLRQNSHSTITITFHLSKIHGNNTMRLNVTLIAEWLISLHHTAWKPISNVIHVWKLRYYDIKQALNSINIQHRQSHLALSSYILILYNPSSNPDLQSLLLNSPWKQAMIWNILKQGGNKFVLWVCLEFSL